MTETTNNISIVNDKMTDTDWEKLETWLKGMLHIDTVTVTFTKKDGTERIMKCTLNPSMLPPASITENKTQRKQPENTLAVYDVEASGWRSFALRSVKRIELVI